MSGFNPTPRGTPAVRARLRYLFRRRFLGTFEWVCPFCGHINRVKDLKGAVFAFACQGVVRRVEGAGARGKCGKRLVFAVIAYTVPRGRLVPPTDMVIPEGLQEAFPAGELHVGVWRSGTPSNIVVVSADELPEGTGTE